MFMALLSNTDGIVHQEFIPCSAAFMRGTKVKPPLSLIKHHKIKTYGGVEV
jgi:hypothetical protein